MLILTIYQTHDISEIEGLDDLLDELGALVNYEVKVDMVSAALGQLAGEIVDILLSDEVQLILTLASIGGILKQIINLLRKKNKAFSLGKSAVKSLAVYEVSEEIGSDSFDLENAKIWGPMVVQSLKLERSSGSFSYRGFPEGIDGYLTAIAVPKKTDRVRTFWRLVTVDYENVITWYTQTLAERVPDFLRPGV